MPTVLRVGSIASSSTLRTRESLPHIHVERDNNVAKLWIDPVRLVTSGGFRRPELREIERVVAENEQTLLEAWHGFFRG